MDKIFLNQLSFYGFHGVLKEEQVLGQRFIVDLTLYADLKEAGQTDDLTKSIHYGEVYETTKTVIESKKYQLIETVAEEISSALLKQFERLKKVKVKVVKPDPPINGHYHSVAVEVLRERNE